MKRTYTRGSWLIATKSFAAGSMFVNSAWAMEKCPEGTSPDGTAALVVGGLIALSSIGYTAYLWKHAEKRMMKRLLSLVVAISGCVVAVYAAGVLLMMADCVP